jgi:PAS domain S-box-containing protein
MSLASSLEAIGDGGLEVLSEDSERVLCRGWRDVGDGGLTAVLAAFPASEHPTPGLVERLAHEYGLKADLDGAWAVRPLALVREHGRTMLLFEDPGGEPLNRLLGRPMEMGRFLHLAIAISVALRQLHDRGLIHKDIKPANVLVNSDTGKIWLMGFGFASRLPRERQAPEPPEFVAGSLPYMAPEQTGRVNRSVDSRSDLYALGVTLYEMLTGSLPFAASDPMEWVHCHIARQPAPPIDRVADVPAAVSAIILKLLAKTAEERYQTAAGAEADLRRCLTDWESRRRIDAFSLGLRDTPDRLLIPEKLYGRAREIDTLLASFDRVVATGTPELVLVSGYSGIGKSSVVNELHKVLVPARGLFAAGKFDQYKRDIPYATLAQALRTLVRQILIKSEAEVDQWRCALKEAVEPNGQLIVNLVPEMEVIIGKQPPVPDLPPRDAQNRFQLVFRRLLGVFARPEHPLALFLDDLQWLDAATLDLLEHLLTHSDVRHLLLVGAYRDNEVSPSHPLMRTLEAIRKVGARVQEIVLAPLGLDDVGQLVADAMHCDPERVRPLAQLVQEKTAGNPFFAIQFFTALADEGLLAFDPVTRAWQWNMDRIRAKSFTDNVVDLMAGKLRRLSATTQEALKQLACLGNVVPIATLTQAYGATAETTHAALCEAIHAGLIFREDGAYKFLHDRIQQAAYTLIPDEQRADVHLRIGRALLASMTVEELGENVFEVANQLNRGAARLIELDENAQVAAIDLRAGRRAKASAAYASAREYFSAGMALLDEKDWSSQYELTFSLWLERAECELLAGNFEKAEQLIAELLQRGGTKVDQAAVYHLKVQLHIVKGENAQGVDSALTCLTLFGIDIPAHPTWEQVQTEYEAVWRNLNGRPIESLIGLPLMTDPELQAAMRLLSVLSFAANFTDFNLYCLHLCRMVNVSAQHGTCGAAAHAYGWFGCILGPAFNRYREGYRFAQLACDLVEKHGFVAYQAKVQYAMGVVSVWTRPIATAIDFNRAAFRSATEIGDLAFACYSLSRTVNDLLVRNEPLDAVWREAEQALDFIRKAKYRDVADIIVSQQRFIATMKGRTATFSTFGDAEFDEAAFEAQLSDDRMPMMICWYWIYKLKARFLSGDYAEALAAADKAKAPLWAAIGRAQLLDYYYYTALTVAALYQNASADEQRGWSELLTVHREQLREWAANYPPTFADKHALVAAEIARIEDRELNAEQLYEQSIRSARENGFVQNEALASELAGRFYLNRGLEKNGYAHLQDARACYALWGADGKVRQLDRLYPRLAAPEGHRLTAIIRSPIQRLDVASVVKASQAMAGEIELPRLIERLMTIAIENAGADHGLLILPADDDYLIQAEAQALGDKVEVALSQKSISGNTCPESLVRYVIRTHESVILDDASRSSLFSEDDYLRGRQTKSILCLPLIKQGRLTGLLYLENTLTSHAFTPDRIALLDLLAAQAAISLENTRLYSDLQEREAKVRRLVDSNIIGIFFWDLDGRIFEANEALLQMVGHSRDDLVSGRVRWSELTPAEWAAASERAAAELRATGSSKTFEKEYFRKDGSRVPVLIGATAFSESRDQGVAFVLDLTERKRAEAALRESEGKLGEAQRIAHVGYWERDLTTDLLTWSDESFRIFGLAPGEGRITYTRFQELIHPEDRQRTVATAAEALRGGRRYHVEYRLVRPDNQLCIVHSQGDVMMDGSGRPRRMFGIVQDITARKRAEEDLRESERRYRETQMELAHVNRVATMGQLTASIAHEVSQPIAAAVTNAGAGLRWLAAQPPNLDKVQDTFNSIIKAGNQAGEVIGRIRGLIKKVPARKTTLDINETIRETVALTRGEMGQHCILLQTELANALPSILGDRVQLQQLILNLIMNAIEAMSEVSDGPRVLLIGSRADTPDGVIVTVQDSGPGLKPESIDHLFDPFYTTKPAGMGMGLSICRSIIEAHGGRLWASANAPRGSVFQFTLHQNDVS